MVILFIVKAAVVTMTDVGDKINEVKKKYEDTIKIQVCMYMCACVCTHIRVCFIQYMYSSHMYLLHSTGIKS